MDSSHTEFNMLTEVCIVLVCLCVNHVASQILGNVYL